MTAPFMRPASGTAVPNGGLPCKERFALDQPTPPGMTPCQAVCLRCGRVTARRDDEGMPWCGGEPPTLPIGAAA